MNLARVKNLGKNHPSNNWPGGSSVPPDYWYPAVMPYYNKRNGNKQDIPYTPEMLRWLRSLQIDDKAYIELLRIAGGIFNRGGNEDYIISSGKNYVPPFGPWPKPPRAQPVTSAGNLVNIIGKNRDWVRIEVLPAGGPIPYEKTPRTHPWLFNNPFTSLKINSNILGNSIDSRGVIVPLFSAGEAWMPMEWLEEGAELPKPPEQENKPMDKKTTNALGIDISQHQPDYDPTVRPVDFVVIKFSEGTTYRDPRALQHLESARSVPIKGGYHYFRSGMNWESQAQNFINAVAGLDLHFLACDYETLRNTLSAATDEDARRIMSYVEKETGLDCLLYSRPSVLIPMIARKSTWVKSCKLWIAQWYERNAFYSRDLSPDFDNWLIWQYGGDYKHPTQGWIVPGYLEGAAWGVSSRSVCLDMYCGTLADMKARFNVKDEQDEKPPEAEPLTELQRLDRIEDILRAHGWL